MSLFFSEYEALTFAYRSADRPVLKVSSAFSSMLGSTVRAPNEMGPYDWVAQAGMIVSRVRASLNEEDLLLVEACFSSPTGEGRVKKEEVVEPLAQRLEKDRRKRLDHWFICDIVRGWVGGRRHHKDSWWANHLEKSEETIRRWRMAEDGKWPGLEKQMEIYLHSTVLKLNAPFIAAGWIGVE